MSEGNSSWIKEKKGIQVDIRVLWGTVRKRVECKNVAVSIPMKALVYS